MPPRGVNKPSSVLNLPPRRVSVPLRGINMPPSVINMHPRRISMLPWRFQHAP